MNVFQTLNKTIYKAFGYLIQSDLNLPELQQINGSDGAIDVVIRYADLAERWTGRSDCSKSYLCTETMVMFKVPDVAIFAAEGGNTITITPEDGVSEDKLRLYILGSCMGAILLQRRILPLHGSAIVINNKAYAFVGYSGHGKSTLASAFLQLGYQLLTDDVIALTLDHENKPYVTPAYPQQKLWQESLNTFGMDAQSYRPLFERETKYAIPVESHFSTDTIQLAGIFELFKSDCSEVQIRPVDKLERLPLLYRHTYRNLLLADSGLMNWHFDITTRLSSSIDIYQLQRPENEPTVHQLTQLVLDAIGT